MTEQEVKLVVGSLLHDVGKVIYRSGDGRNHSKSGYDYLKDEIHIDDPAILEPVLYHHADMLKSARIADDSGAYITYIADNIAAASDRRKSGDGNYGFEVSMPLQPVFNILKGNHGQQYYHPQMLDGKKMNYPTEKKQAFDEVFYKQVKEQLTVTLNQIEWSEQYINSLLAVLEATMTYIPSSTSKQEIADVSLYDHIKITAAVSSCIYQYLKEQGVQDYKKVLFQEAKEFYAQKAFLLYAIDLSGIQAFIYTIHSKDALKMLRARSFYLEIMMEHIIDELLERVSLSRANLIYSGGGHCYILMPNTSEVDRIVEAYEKEINEWLRKTFDIELYIACGFAEASPNTLRNVPQGSYEEMYLKISRMMSQKKAHRYDAETIHFLNNQSYEGKRECKICQRIAKLQDGKCTICNTLEKLGSKIMHYDCFAILTEHEVDALPLPGEKYLVVETMEQLKEHMQADSYVRSYTKNNFYTGKHVSNKLWVGDYFPQDANTFEDMAQKACGIKKIAVLRADVDNLGTTFVSGFKRGEDTHYVTLSRTATLSRQLSLFFKGYINQLLVDGTGNMFAPAGARNVVIVYSGGDDVFIAGAWNEVIAVFCDLRQALEKFTLGTLTISGGIGVYDASYPVNVIARETQELEDASKCVDGKNAITIWNHEHTYAWDEFVEKVVGEKMQALDDYFNNNEQHGMAFLYHLTELLRNANEKIHIARYVYLLSRMEPDEKSDPEIKALYRKFSEKMYLWSQDKKDRKELITAIYLYVYMHRSDEKGA